MRSPLESYLNRIYDTLHSRRDIEVEMFQIYDRSLASTSQPESRVEIRTRFWDGSLLEIHEALIVRGHVFLTLEKVAYAYHYQRPDGSFIRYDNAPHHPELPGFPEHKHVSGQEQPQPAPAPDLTDVLREIDAILYPQGKLS